MIEARDSAYPPSDGALALARAAGVRAWPGYFAGPNILNGWSDSDFRRVLAAGLATWAYCSGWSDPTALKIRAAGLGIRGVLDDEYAIRPHGAWAQNWLNLSGFGLYGPGPDSGASVHGLAAASHILAEYPRSGDPGGESWPSWLARPAGPCAWQWAGTHAEFGVTCDSEWCDDWFGPDMALRDDPDFFALIERVEDIHKALIDSNDANAGSYAGGTKPVPNTFAYLPGRVTRDLAKSADLGPLSNQLRVISAILTEIENRLPGSSSADPTVAQLLGELKVQIGGLTLKAQ